MSLMCYSIAKIMSSFQINVLPPRRAVLIPCPPFIITPWAADRSSSKMSEAFKIPATRPSLPRRAWEHTLRCKISVSKVA